MIFLGLGLDVKDAYCNSPPTPAYKSAFFESNVFIGGAMIDKAGSQMGRDGLEKVDNNQ